MRCRAARLQRAPQRSRSSRFDQFAAPFTPPEQAKTLGWVRFHMLRGVADEDGAITFGFFTGSLKETERSQEQMGYQAQRVAVEPFADTLIANGLCQIVVDAHG